MVENLSCFIPLVEVDSIQKRAREGPVPDRMCTDKIRIGIVSDKNKHQTNQPYLP